MGRIHINKDGLDWRSAMSDHPVLSEKPEDNQAAVEWGLKQAELRRKSDEITRELNEKYRPILIAKMEMSETKSLS